MALNLSQKQEVVAELAGVAAKAHSLIVTEYAGITVPQMTAMRKQARESGVYLKVVKNTLAARALEGTEYAIVKEKLIGPLLYAFSLEEAGAAGRLIRSLLKTTSSSRKWYLLVVCCIRLAMSMFSRRCQPDYRLWPC